MHCLLCGLLLPLSPNQLRDSCEHRNWCGFSKLQGFLTEAGFSRVMRCQPGKSRYNFRINIERTHRSWYSMYVEAEELNSGMPIK